MPKSKKSLSEKVPQISPARIPMSSSIRELRYLSFQGGGMKGIGDVGALEALEEHGVLSQIEAVAGSSVGGIMAMLVAIGCTPEEIKQEMFHLDFKALQDKATPGWIESMHLHHLMPANVSGGIEKMEDIIQFMLGSSLGLFEGDRLCYVLATMLAKKGLSPNLSFSELAALASHPGSPQKKLVLTGSNLSDPKHPTEYYSSEDTPQMSIIEAVRISASFPGAFKPIKKIETVMENGLEKKVEVVRVDGGLLENLPDVFNKKPYYTPTQERPGNPQVLALSFQHTESQAKIKRGTGLFKKLYNVVLSEDRLKKKYESNLVDIDTLGMETLEFDASETKKQDLVNSGRQAVYKTLNTILENEEKADIAAEHTGAYTSTYSVMSLDDLIKKEAALEIELLATETEEIPNFKQRTELKLAKVREFIFKKAKAPEVALSQEVLKEMQQKAKNRLKAIQAKQKESKASLSEDNLLKLCSEKKQSLERMQLLIEHRFDDLHIARFSLIDYRDHLKEKIQSNQTDRAKQKDRKGFSDDLEELLGLQSQRTQSFLESGVSLASDRYKKHDDAIKQCLKQKIAKYRGSHHQAKDDFLACFFEDFLQKSPDFTVPLDAPMIHEMLRPDIEECDNLIQACQNEMAHNIKEKHVFERQALSLSEKSSKGDQYAALLDFNMELDAHIYRETHFLEKLNNFFISHTPRLAIITQPFFEAISMAAFIAFLPLAIPAKSIASVIGHFSKNEALKMQATKVEHFFHYKNLNHQTRLKVIQKETKKFCELMKKKYDSTDYSETSYLFKLYALYLKQSGIAFEDIVQRRPHETLAIYKVRVEKMKHQFEILSYRDRAIATIGYDENDSKPELHQDLRAEVMKAMHGIKPDDIKQIENLQKLGIDPCDLEFFYQIRQKMAAGQRLTENEQLDFMDLGPKFKKEYSSLYREFERVYAENLRLLRSPEKTIMRGKLVTKQQDPDKNHGLHYFKQMKDQHKAAAHQKMGTYKTPPTASQQASQTRSHDKHFKPKP